MTAEKVEISEMCSKMQAFQKMCRSTGVEVPADMIAVAVLAE